MNKTIVTIGIILVVIIGGYYVFRGSYEIPPVTPDLGEEIAPQETGVIQLDQEELWAPITEITMESGNFFFGPKDLTLAKDQPVKIIFKNKGTHTFTIDELEINVPLQGSSAEVEFAPAKAGTFEYYCAIPGHRERGMFGSLKVE